MNKLTVEQACGFLGISRATLYRRLRDHRISTERRGSGEVVIDLESLERIKLQPKRKAMMKSSDLADILDRLTALETSVERLTAAVGLGDLSKAYRPQEAPLFRRLVSDILGSDDLSHKYVVFKTYLERLPAIKAIEIFQDPRALVTAYYKVVKYLADKWKLSEMEELLRLRGRIEIVAALIPSTASSTDAGQRCQDDETPTSKP
jgi:excisionase family DNA binding protein